MIVIVTIIHQNVMVTKDFGIGIEIEMLDMINIALDVTQQDHRFHLVTRVAANDVIHTVLTQDQTPDPIPLSVTPEVQVVLDTIQIQEIVEHVRLCLRWKIQQGK